ncbi:MAG: hypothetical protein KBD78_14805 [Oligoflexales bacterium]|nr:hypothetical protein [Oligoflexales bacterium]
MTLDFFAPPMYGSIGQVGTNYSPMMRLSPSNWQFEDRLLFFGGFTLEPSYTDGQVEIHTNDMWEFLPY